METTLLRTKLYIPHVRPGLVQRTRLLKWLDEGLDHKLTILSAPAGYGKTTLLSAWAAACVYPLVWLALDKDDNDPHRFLAYLIASAQSIKPKIGEEILLLLQPPRPVRIEELLPALINQLDDIPGPFAIVWDDYHLITSPEVHRAVVYLLEHQPQAMHLYISTRVDPPLPVAQMRAWSQLTEQVFEHARSAGDRASINRLVDTYLYPLWTRGEFDHGHIEMSRNCK